MTVDELKKELEKYPGDMPVYIDIDAHYPFVKYKTKMCLLLLKVGKKHYEYAHAGCPVDHVLLFTQTFD